MKLGTQGAIHADEDLRILAQLGVTHVSIDPPGEWTGWDADALARHRDRIASFGLVLDMIQLPLPSDPLERAQCPSILLGTLERDKAIDDICALIERLAAAGIPAAKYNLNIIGIPRTPREAGRGGAMLPTFRWEAAEQDAPPGIAGVLSEEENWARIDYFLARVVPVATAARVRLACHPHDPYTPPGYKGVTRVLGTVDGLKRFVQMHESPFHGLNFCQGTVAEMLDDPDGEIDDVIRWFGERNKIFNVHFRNIRGRKLSFTEVLPDDGDMDMARTLRLYAELGYAHMVMPDHVPLLAGDNPDRTAFAFSFGYIRGLMDSLPKP